MKKRVSLETTVQQQSKLFEKLHNKPLWIWDHRKHKLEDIRRSGFCCFNHIIGLPQRNVEYKPLYDYQKIVFDSLVTQTGNIRSNNKHLWIKKATGLGISEFMLRFMSHVSDLQLEDLPGVQPHLISKLKQAGIQTVLDLAVSIPQELAPGGEGSVISADTETISQLVLKAKKALADSGALIKEFSTADQVLERRKSLVRFTTGSKNLDDFLKGGVESQAITELAGEFGSGKSQICHTLCVTAAKGDQGQINSMIFIDTENTFRPERVHQIAEARGLDSEEIMKKVFVCKIVNSAQLEALIRNLGKSIEEYKAKLVIVDSIISNIQEEKLWLKDSRDSM